MYTQANKQKTGNQIEEKRHSQKESVIDSVSQFQDKRPEYHALSQIRDAANTGLQAKKITQFQDMRDQGAEQNLPVQKHKNTTGLPDKLKSGVENLSGYSLDDVKVHYNSDKPAQLQAHAYARGTDIHVAPGQENHLPHEAWHVVQQKQGRVKPTVQLKAGIAVNDDTGLEKEADMMGEKALQQVSVGEPERDASNPAVTGRIAQLQTAKDPVPDFESELEEADEEDFTELLQSIPELAASDLGEEDESEESDFQEVDEPGLETDDSEEIQLAKNNAVIQAMRGPEKKNKKYYLNKLARSLRFLLKTKHLIETGQARFRNRKEAEQMYTGFEEMYLLFKELKESSVTKLGFEVSRKIERMTLQNNRIYFRIIRERIERERQENFFSKTDSEGVDRTVVTEWYKEIKSKNSRILNLILAVSDPTKHPWFLMDYVDIVDSQAEEADRAIQEGIVFLMGHSNNNVSFVCNNILSYLSKTYTLPLVYFQKAEPTKFHGTNVIRVEYQINPTYTKYVDPTKTGQGSEGIQILGDSTNTKVRTDIRFIPGSLKIGDQTSPVGMQMEATHLSQDSPVGSEAQKDSSQDLLMGNIEKIMGDKSTKYVKGHLLNDHLGGPARPYNLFPITEQANNDHLVFMEKYVKAEVEKGYVMYYKVNITNPSVNDLKPSASTHLRRYSVNADIECESAKLDINEKPIEKHNVTVKSVWSGGDVLDSTGGRIRKKGDTSSSGTDLATHADFTRKMNSGKPDQGVTNPDVKDPDSKTHLIYKKTGYDQDDMHKGKLSDSNLTSTITGAIPFSISGSKDDLSTALQPSVASAIGKHYAGLIWSSSFIVSGKIKAGITENELISIKGVGPATIKKLKDNFEIQ